MSEQAANAEARAGSMRRRDIADLQAWVDAGYPALDHPEWWPVYTRHPTRAVLAGIADGLKSELFKARQVADDRG